MKAVRHQRQTADRDADLALSAVLRWTTDAPTISSKKNVESITSKVMIRACRDMPILTVGLDKG